MSVLDAVRSTGEDMSSEDREEGWLDVLLEHTAAMIAGAILSRAGVVGDASGVADGALPGAGVTVNGGPGAESPSLVDGQGRGNEQGGMR